MIVEVHFVRLGNGENSGIQLELQNGNRELEIEIPSSTKLPFLKDDGNEMEEGIIEPSRIFELLSWLMEEGVG